MIRTNLIIAASIAAICSVAHAATAEPAAMLAASNPFAKVSPLQYGYPQFDKIKDEDYAPAFEEGMRQQAAEIEKIANNKAPATFDNTIVAMEKSGRLLARVSSVFGNLSGANTNDTFKALERDLSPKRSAHGDAIRLNPKLYARIKSLYDLSLIHI